MQSKIRFKEAANEELNIPENIIIKHIPPYSPELNSSENMWKEIRNKFFGKLAFKSLNAVEDRLIEASLFYEDRPELVESITGFDWIIDAIEKAYKVIY